MKGVTSLSPCIALPLLRVPLLKQWAKCLPGYGFRKPPEYWLFLLKLGDSVLLIPEASLPHNQSKTHPLIITQLLA